MQIKKSKKTTTTNKTKNKHVKDSVVHVRVRWIIETLKHPVRTVVAFPCFTVVKSFTSWYALLLLFFLRLSSVSLHCSPIQFSFAFFMHLLKLLFTSLYFFRSFRFKSFLSQLSPLVAQIKNFCSDPGFFSSDDVCQRSYWLFQSLLC